MGVKPCSASSKTLCLLLAVLDISQQKSEIPSSPGLGPSVGDDWVPALDPDQPGHGVPFLVAPTNPPGSTACAMTTRVEAEPLPYLGEVKDLLSDLAACRLPQLERKVEDVLRLLAAHRKDMFTVDELAELTGRSAYTVRRWIAEGKLAAIRVTSGGPRGRLLIARAELDKLIASGKGACIPESAVNTVVGGAR
jgi:excisionase family DNA binding protein